MFLSELNPLDKCIPSVWLPEVRQECLRVIPCEEQCLKRDISRNNNRIILILQRRPVQKVVTHLWAAEWRLKIKERSIAEQITSGKMFREQGISKQGNPELMRLAIQLDWLWKHMSSVYTVII